MGRTLGSKNINLPQGNEDIPQSALKDEYATKDALNSLIDSVTHLAGIVRDLAEKKDEVKNPDPNLKPIPVDEAKPDLSPIPPSWRKMVDEILGLDFGLNVSYPDKGSGFLFKIIVPMEKSNMPEAQRQMYKVDIRTKAISYGEGVDGVKRYCELVAQNLKRK